jgi:tRNA pseudouridine32 synthase/23S rRNA pseudouridine746 synthase
MVTLTRPWSVVFQDAHLLVVNKPSGLLSVPGRGPDKQDCLWTQVQQHAPAALVVHRLDQATSGLMMFALSPDVQRSLSMAFEARQVQKKYHAWVEGVMPVQAEWQTIDMPVLLDWPNRPVHIIDPSGKPSQTLWRCIEHHALHPASLLELQPLTGRTHQLRVHLKAIGHPIWGDALYAPPNVQARSPRLMLHATALGLLHPLTQQPLHWACPPDFAPHLDGR